jgi:phosphate starvation-inducible protein PhoH and related proteins
MEKYNDEFDTFTYDSYFDNLLETPNCKYPKTNKKSKKERKNTTQNDVVLKLKDIEPKTDTQELVFESFFNDNNLVLSGTAGTGKTFLLLYLALNEIINNKEYKKIHIIRSIVPTRDIGFLPGKIAEKIEPYELPYKNIFDELFGRQNAYDHFKKNGIVNFEPSSFLRGNTFNDSIVIVDEFQNMSFNEFSTIMTRIGINTKVLIAGDLKQTDLTKKEELGSIKKIFEVLKQMKSIDFIEFYPKDIVRSNFVRDWILACEYIENRG